MGEPTIANITTDRWHEVLDQRDVLQRECDLLRSQRDEAVSILNAFAWCQDPPFHNGWCGECSGCHAAKFLAGLSEGGTP